MSKIKHKKAKFHWIHIIAVLVLGGYFFLSKVNMVHAFTRTSVISTFMQLYLFGIVFGCLFLYIFSHEKFFPFAKDMEKQEEKKEKKYLNKYLHHGKILATFLIGAIGGPIFSSLTARLLLKNYAFKYFVVILANIPSSLMTVGIGQGLIKFVNF